MVWFQVESNMSILPSASLLLTSFHVILSVIKYVIGTLELDYKVDDIGIDNIYQTGSLDQGMLMIK